MVNTEWKNAVRILFREFLVLYPGSFTEEKESSIAYHYRTAGKDVGSKAKPVIRKKFSLLCSRYPGLELLAGNKVVEIKPKNFDKGRIAATILKRNNFGFILAAGDDVTDEKLFARLPNDSFTIKIGRAKTCAKYRIGSQTDFVKFLKDFT